MAFGYQPMMPQQGMTRVMKRPITGIERQLAAKSYKTLQNALRVFSIMPLVIFIISYILTNNGLMEFPLGLILGIMIIAFSIAAIGMAVNLLSTRKKMGEVMREGMIIEVQGPAFKNRAIRNMPTITIGPISLMETPEIRKLIVEGAQTSVVCIPKMKAAISINNTPLLRGSRMTCPPNIEMMAEQGYPGAQQLVQPMMQQALGMPIQPAPQNQQYSLQQPMFQQGLPQYAQQAARCPNCGNPVQPQWTACTFCGARLAQ